MLLIYTGEGKGKTSASVGQCIRALGQGMRVAFAQFMKRNGQAGEQLILLRLLQENFLAGGAGFFRMEQERPIHRAAVLHVVAWVEARLAKGLDLLILDESLNALDTGLLEQHELETLLTSAAAAGTHVVLSGRGAPTWLLERADLATSMTEVKHPWNTGVSAQRGIEY